MTVAGQAAAPSWCLWWRRKSGLVRAETAPDHGNNTATDLCALGRQSHQGVRVQTCIGDAELVLVNRVHGRCI